MASDPQTAVELAANAQIKRAERDRFDDAVLAVLTLRRPADTAKIAEELPAKVFETMAYSRGSTTCSGVEQRRNRVRTSLLRLAARGLVTSTNTTRRTGRYGVLHVWDVVEARKVG